MQHFYLLILSILSFEILRFFKIIKLFDENFTLYRKIYILIINVNIDDNKKKIELFQYSKKLFLNSLMIILILILILLVSYIIYLFDDYFLSSIISIVGIIEITLYFFIYYLIRKLK